MPSLSKKTMECDGTQDSEGKIGETTRKKIARVQVRSYGQPGTLEGLLREKNDPI